MLGSALDVHVAGGQGQRDSARDMVAHVNAVELKAVLVDQAPADLDVALANQARAIDAVLYIKVPEDLLMARLTGRWCCPECGAIFHELTSPPAEKGKCDVESPPLSELEKDSHHRVACWNPYV